MELSQTARSILFYSLDETRFEQILNNPLWFHAIHDMKFSEWPPELVALVKDKLPRNPQEDSANLASR